MTAIRSTGQLDPVMAAAPAVDQAQAPLLEAVLAAASAAQFRAHVPGHLGGRAAAADVLGGIGRGVFNADVWLDPAHLDEVRREAETLAAAAWGASRAWLVGNGSTAGNIAWCVAMLREGDEVLVARDAHVSILTGLMLSGARPRWVSPAVHPQLGLPLGLEVAALTAALRRHPKIRTVILSSPSYAGTCTDLAACVEAARAQGVLVYVDQAWGGAHAFHPGLPLDAMRAGAAGAVVSVHKSGSALSSGAVLLAGPGADIARLAAAVRETQTTSPLLPLLASLDAARRDLATEGPRELAGVMATSLWLAQQIRLIPGLHVAGPPELGLPADRVDVTKIVVDVSGLGHTGWQVDTMLRERGVPPEGADVSRIHLVLGAREASAISTASALLAELQLLALALGDGGPADTGPVTPSVPPDNGWALMVEPGDTVLTPRQARQAPAVRVEACAAVGHIAAEPVVPYPPGVPAILPGEVVTASALRVMRAVRDGGGHLHGCADPSGASLWVVIR